MTSFLGSKEALAGFVTIGIGAAVVLTTLDYGMGTPRQMGPGFFPVILGGLMCLVGLMIVIGAIHEREALPIIPWRAFVVMPLAILAFALLLPRTGLAPAGFASVVIAGLAQGGRPGPGLFILAAVLVPAVWALFTQLLGVPIPFLDWSL